MITKTFKLTICTETEIEMICEAYRLVRTYGAEEEETGSWWHCERMLTCSVCETEFYDDIMECCDNDVPKYCPNCGAKMEKEPTRWYVCAPEKHKECKKGPSCQTDCFLTTHKEYSKDGRELTEEEAFGELYENIKNLEGKA